MPADKFPVGVEEKIGLYVYRLIDPRNGETFYVGKGKGDRVFQHAKGALVRTDDTESLDEIDLKTKRIRDIIAARLDVSHVIHRHNIKDDETAYQIEAALIDAYPGLANIVGGHSSGDYGCRHADQIISEYEVAAFTATEPLVLISIGKSYDEEGRDIYDAARAAWRIDQKRAGLRLVLAHKRGLVVGAFRPNKWVPAMKSEFPWLETDIPKRFGFHGARAEEEVVRQYVGKRVPDKLRAKGAANPVRFVEPEEQK